MQEHEALYGYEWSRIDNAARWVFSNRNAQGIEHVTRLPRSTIRAEVRPLLRECLDLMKIARTVLKAFLATNPGVTDVWPAKEWMQSTGLAWEATQAAQICLLRAALPAARKGNRFAPGRPKGSLGPVATLVHQLAPQAGGFDDLVVLLQNMADRRLGGVSEVDAENETVFFGDRKVDFKTLRNYLSKAKNPEKR